MRTVRQRDLIGQSRVIAPACLDQHGKSPFCGDLRF
jgi:hypothetical protein